LSSISGDVFVGSYLPALSLMKRKQRAVLPVKNQPVSAMDAQAIDALYGLEPVFEPDALNMDAGPPTQFVPLTCPYCGESYLTCIDLTNGSCAYVEDCQVCCQPMELVIELDESGALQSFAVRQLG
jgi:Cysteine-rich CPXCG